LKRPLRCRPDPRKIADRSTRLQGARWPSAPELLAVFDGPLVMAGQARARGSGSDVWPTAIPTLLGAVTPTAGGLVFFGDAGGNFYALDAATGQKLWGWLVEVSTGSAGR
jgi:hypothetical protein